jgi:hypothetical protein
MHSEALLFGFDFEAARAIVRALDGCCLNLNQMSRTKRLRQVGKGYSIGGSAGMTWNEFRSSVLVFPARPFADQLLSDGQPQPNIVRRSIQERLPRADLGNAPWEAIRSLVSTNDCLNADCFCNHSL